MLLPRRQASRVGLNRAGMLKRTMLTTEFHSSVHRSWEIAQEAVAAASAGEHDAAAAAVAAVAVAVVVDGPHDGVDADAVAAASPAVLTPGHRASPPAARFSRPSSAWPRACATSPSAGTLCLGGSSGRIYRRQASRCTDTWRASSWCTSGHSLLGCRRLRQSLAEAAPGPLSCAGCEAKRLSAEADGPNPIDAGLLQW
jgi:hypothetical protein